MTAGRKERNPIKCIWKLYDIYIKEWICKFSKEG